MKVHLTVIIPTALLSEQGRRFTCSKYNEPSQHKGHEHRRPMCLLCNNITSKLDVIAHSHKLYVYIHTHVHTDIYIRIHTDNTSYFMGNVS